MQNVLVIGDSRIGEGVSAAIANDLGHSAGVNFVVVGLAGTTARVWFYVLRAIDPQHRHYRDILLMDASLRDDQTFEHPSERILDTAYLAPILRLQDLPGYAASFSEPTLRWQASEAILYPEIPLQSDIMGLCRNPLARFTKARFYRANYPTWYAAYPGRDITMPALTAITPEHGPAALPDDLSAATRQAISTYFKQWTDPSLRTPAIETAAYRLAWIGGIADAYRGSGTTIKAFRIPRGPYQAALQTPGTPEGELVTLQRAGRLRIIDPAASLTLEEPAYFADTLHLNSKGRAAFSRIIAQEELADLAAEPSPP